MEASVIKFERLAGKILKLLCDDKFRVLAEFAVSICRVEE